MRITGIDGNTKIDSEFYTGLGGVSLRLVRALVLLYSKFAVGITNGRERERGSQVSRLHACECVCVCVCVCVCERVRVF